MRPAATFSGRKGLAKDFLAGAAAKLFTVAGGEFGTARLAAG